MDYITLEQLVLRDEERLPRLYDGSLNEERVKAAIADASSVIRTYLPFLIGEDGKPVEPPARLKDTLVPICRDIALYLLNERPGEENADARYKRAIRMLEALASGGSTLESGSGSVSAGGGIEAMDDDSSAIIDGYSQFLPPGGIAH